MNPLTGVLSEAWALYRRYASHFILISFAIYLVVAIINLVLSLAGTFGTLLGLVVTMFGMFLLQAALIKAVQDVRDGRVDLDLRETVNAARPFVLPVAGASILASIAIGIGFALIIVPGLILLTFLSLIVPWIVIGGSGAIDSFGRSWRTVRGYAWNVFATYVVTWLLLIVGSIIVSLILSALPRAAASFISSVVVGTLVAPFIATVVTLVYFRLTAAHGEPAEPGGAASAGGYGGFPPGGGGYGPPPGGGGYGPPPGGGGFGPPPGGYGPPPGGGYGDPA
jgi:uncharacterized protein (DUF697 family)